ncbi:NUDIX domain-containing protein [Candidatus Woesearchaeota archaeon]|nr:NUDIX domain-containing protein [Candidatus Woesearchaeota archaeon]
MKTDIVVAGLIFNKDKVLLVKHKKLGLWLPVGGHIDKNETPDEALLREIKEETNLEVRILSKNKMSLDGNVKKNLAVPFHANVHSVGDHDHCCFFYLCKSLNSKKLKINNELDDFKWISKKELKSKGIPADVGNIGLKAFGLYERLTN